MSAIAPALEAFFTERLVRQNHVSPHTVASYRDAFRMLLSFAADETGKAPSDLGFEDLDAGLIGAFLEHLEHERANTVRTRNTRLAAIRSFFRYATYREPAHAASIARVLAIPEKRTHRNIVTYLTAAESAALLAAPDREIWVGRRDHAILAVMLQTGVRVSELTRLNWVDVGLGAGPHILVHGKGRKERCTPLTRHSVGVLRTWAKETGDNPQAPVFTSRRHGPLSTDAVSDLVAKYTALGVATCPTLVTKKVTPHTLRHTCAMRLLEAGVDISVIALWLGHEHIQTTQIYLHADLTLKEKALARTAPPDTPVGRYRPPDKLLAFLESL
jgi:site-specific recombinase XerD